MARTLTLQDRFVGMRRDESRDAIPRDYVYNLVDYIPEELGAPIAKRGGWAYASEALTGTLANADRVPGLIFAEFTAGAQLVAVVRDDGVANTQKLAQIVSTSSTTDRGTCNLPSENLSFYRNKVYITDNAGVAAPQTYDGSSSAATLAGSPPTGSVSGSYKDRLLLARSSGEPQRIWFSDAGDPTTWDTSTRYFDMDGPIRCIYTLRNQILVWHLGSLERIIGSIPPPGTDMQIQPVWRVGCDHPRSIAGTDQFVCFANATGVYITDGSDVVDLAEKGGMSSYWRTLTASAASLSLSGGFGYGYYFVSVRDGNTTLLDAFMIHLGERRWIRLANFSANVFARRTTGFEELYFGDSGEARVNSTSGIFTPTSANKNDGDGTAVAPVLETGFYNPTAAKELWKLLLVSYDLRDAASDNPVLTPSIVETPESTSYTALTNYSGSTHTLTETSSFDRVKRQLRTGMAHGIGLKLAQTNSSSVTKLYRIEAEAYPLESNRV